VRDGEAKVLGARLFGLLLLGLLFGLVWSTHGTSANRCTSTVVRFLLQVAGWLTIRSCASVALAQQQESDDKDISSSHIHAFTPCSCQSDLHQPPHRFILLVIFFTKLM
jgi:hypothetical protein